MSELTTSAGCPKCLTLKCICDLLSDYTEQILTTTEKMLEGMGDEV